MTQPKPKTSRSPRKTTPKQAIAKVEKVEPVTPVDELKDGDVVIKFNANTIAYAVATGFITGILHVIFGNAGNPGNGGDRPS